MSNLVHFAVYNRDAGTAVLLTPKRPDIKISKPGKIRFGRGIISAN
ncbi:MAG: hypothetical protein U9O82_07455 [Thermodesulfobacteriota bacterium]|nr:hypothetical protein [Thermodesulfobacteriota bacterium]